LSIDVSVPEHNLSAEDVYADLWRFCQFGFAETSNMDHVLVRVVERHADRDELLVALRATRDQWRAARDEDHNGRQAIPSILQKTFQMKYPEAWRQLTREQTISRATLYDNRFVMI